jgi:hypothetical protein
MMEKLSTERIGEISRQNGHFKGFQKESDSHITLQNIDHIRNSVLHNMPDTFRKEIVSMSRRPIKQLMITLNSFADLRAVLSENFQATLLIQYERKLLIGLQFGE